MLEIFVRSAKNRKPAAPATLHTEAVPDRENDRRQRRRFSADEKCRILSEAEVCSDRSDLAARLRREGIYSSLLSHWRAQLRVEDE